MSTHKTLDRICSAVTVLSVLLTILFMNGEALGLQKITDEDAETYTGDTIFTANDQNGAWDTSSATVITLEGEGGTISGNGAYFLNGNLVIANAGRYVLSGELTDGSVCVDTHDGAKVWILLSGVNLYCSDDACIRIEEADKVFLTLAEGTENTLESGSGYSEEALEDKTGGVIFSRDDLTINGSGSLTIQANYKHGIDVNDSLVITGGSIAITSAQDAIHVNDSINLTGAELTLRAGDDAIHCDTSIGIYGGTIRIESCYEGIEAPQITIEDGEITIYSSDDGLNANGGSSNASGFGGMETLPTITINGGTITIVNTDGRDADGIDSNGDIRINGGTVFVSLESSGGNNGLDYGSENGGSCIINGGTVIVGASSTMAEEISSSSTQCSVLWLPESQAPAGSTAVLQDADGSTILSREFPCSATAVVLSSPEITQGGTYTLAIESEGEILQTEEVTFDQTAVTAGNTASGSAMGGAPQGGQMQGGPMQGGQMQGGPMQGGPMQGGQMQDGSMPPMEAGERGDPMPGMEAGMQGSQVQSETSESGFQPVTEYGADTWILLLLSAAALLSGIMFVRAYR